VRGWRGITPTRTRRFAAGTTSGSRPSSRLEYRARHRDDRLPGAGRAGRDDEYGTLEQIRAVARRLPKTRLLVIPECGHSPHRDQPALLAREAGRFILETFPS
jgi:pimeloyl-ACP methyl ester carboxylesterase